MGQCKAATQSWGPTAPLAHKICPGKLPSWSHHRRPLRPTLNLSDQSRAWRIFWTEIKMAFRIPFQ